MNYHMFIILSCHVNCKQHEQSSIVPLGIRWWTKKGRVVIFAWFRFSFWVLLWVSFSALTLVTGRASSPSETSITDLEKFSCWTNGGSGGGCHCWWQLRVITSHVRWDVQCMLMMYRQLEADDRCQMSILPSPVKLSHVSTANDVTSLTDTAGEYMWSVLI